MKLGKISYYFIIFFFFKTSFILSEILENDNINLNKVPSTFEENKFTEEEEVFFQKKKLNIKKKESEKYEISFPFVEIIVLDKISSKTTNLKIKIGDEKKFENLKIKPLKCKAPEFDDSSDAIAYLQVVDVTQKDKDKVFVFNDWTFSSSPSLRPFDHAIYDIWLIACYNV